MVSTNHCSEQISVFFVTDNITATDGLSLNVTPLDFLKVNMNKKLLTSITLPALDPAQYIFRSFKIMPVAQNSRAYVNAAFLIKFCRTGETSEAATVCFGGINPSFVHAYKTENFLLGRPLFTNETLQEALKILSTELRPDWVLPDASPKYRKGLALSLFYKFMLSTAPESSVYLNPRFRSGGTVLKRPVSSGKQSYDTYPKKWPLTQYVPKIEGLAQSAGEAEYIADIPTRPNDLHAAFVLATEIQSRITKIDATEALVGDSWCQI